MDYGIMNSDRGTLKSVLFPFLLELKGSLFNVHPMGIPLLHNCSLLLTAKNNAVVIFQIHLRARKRALVTVRDLVFQITSSMSTETASDLTATYGDYPLHFASPH